MGTNFQDSRACNSEPIITDYESRGRHESGAGVEILLALRALRMTVAGGIDKPGGFVVG